MTSRDLMVALAATLSLANAQPGPPVNSGAAILQDFEKRVAGYVKVHKAAEGKLHSLKPTASPEKIMHHEHELRHGIRDARRSARAGDIFTPEISAEFRRLIGLAMQAGNASRIKGSLKRDEPVALRLRVNDAYPQKVPLQSTPPTLLLNLPHLPAEVEYRVVGHDLALLDAKANLIVDLIHNAIP